MPNKDEIETRQEIPMVQIAPVEGDDEAQQERQIVVPLEVGDLQSEFNLAKVPVNHCYLLFFTISMTIGSAL